MGGRQPRCSPRLEAHLAVSWSPTTQSELSLLTTAKSYPTAVETIYLALEVSELSPALSCEPVGVNEFAKVTRWRSVSQYEE